MNSYAVPIFGTVLSEFEGDSDELAVWTSWATAWLAWSPAGASLQPGSGGEFSN
jgi:hypothetical protein